jgi:hypothetical protein
MSTCASLRGTIVALQAPPKTLGGLVDVIDGSRRREELQRQMAPTRGLLEMRLTELSGMEVLLRASWRYVQQPIGYRPKSMVTHHTRILREAGVTRTRPEGRNGWISLRREVLDAKCPGLLDVVLAVEVDA